MNNSTSLVPMMAAPQPRRNSAEKKKEEDDVKAEIAEVWSTSEVAAALGPLGLGPDAAEILTKLMDPIKNTSLDEAFGKIERSINDNAITEKFKEFFEKMLTVNPSSSVVNLSHAQTSPVAESRSVVNASADSAAKSSVGMNKR